MKRISLLIALFFICLYSYAQQGATNAGNLQIHPTASITVFGDFLNTSTSALINNGNLYFRGHISNNQAAMIAGTGSLILNGAATQSITGTEPFKTFNLTTNNSTGIVLNNNLSVAGTHSFVSGNVASSATPNYLIYEAGSNHTGSGDGAHVTGWVKKSGNTAFTFPTGNGTYLRDIAISNLSGSLEIDGRYSGATQNTNNLESPLVAINPGEYWTLNNITGGSTTLQVTLNWNNPKIPFPNYVVPDIRSARYNTATNLWTSTGGSATGLTASNGSVTSTQLTTLGSLSIGSETTVVPLYFLSVTAEKKTGYNVIKWITSNEVNVKEYQVQRKNASGFETIGIVAAHNLWQAQTYSLHDVNNLSGTVYYRIKSVDFDEKIKYSKVVSILTGIKGEIITLVNNPVKNTIHLSLTSTKNASFVYQIITSGGSIVQQGNLQYSGSGKMAIPLHFNAIKGSYILLINDGKNSFTQKIIAE